MILVRGVLGTVRELFQFLWERKLWWLMPMMALLLVFAVLLVLGSVAGVGPFIYTIF